VFFGEFEYRVDDKGRLPIPPKFRTELRDGVVLTLGMERCITAYPLAEWKKLAATLITGPVATAKIRTLNRAMFASAFHLVTDGQGRVALPAPLREHAEIGAEAVVVGANSYFEIWNCARWQEERLKSQEQAWQIIESLENR
jgi:MraZ protein